MGKGYFLIINNLPKALYWIAIQPPFCRIPDAAPPDAGYRCRMPFAGVYAAGFHLSAAGCGTGIRAAGLLYRGMLPTGNLLRVSCIAGLVRVYTGCG